MVTNQATPIKNYLIKDNPVKHWCSKLTENKGNYFMPAE